MSVTYFQLTVKGNQQKVETFVSLLEHSQENLKSGKLILVDDIEIDDGQCVITGDCGDNTIRFLTHIKTLASFDCNNEISLELWTENIDEGFQEHCTIKNCEYSYEKIDNLITVHFYDEGQESGFTDYADDDEQLIKLIDFINKKYKLDFTIDDFTNYSFIQKNGMDEWGEDTI